MKNCDMLAIGIITGIVATKLLCKEESKPPKACKIKKCDPKCQCKSKNCYYTRYIR